MDDLPITAAGREISDGLDRIRRYCGMAWSGGPPETWAWPYYDAIPSRDPARVDPVDVLCAAALHPGLARRDLAFFRESAADIESWLSGLPAGLRLWEISDAEVNHVVRLPESIRGASVSLVSKVLHRKRPELIPLIDRHIIDWYRPVTGKRAGAEAWEPLVRSMRDDQMDDAWRLLMAMALMPIEEELWPGIDLDERLRLSWIRAVDIAIWMGSR